MMKAGSKTWPSSWVLIGLVALAPCAALATGYSVPQVPEPCADKNRPAGEYDLLCRSPDVWPLLYQARILDERLQDNVPDLDAYLRRQSAFGLTEHSDCPDSDCLAAKLKENMAWLKSQLTAYPHKRQPAPLSPKLASYLQRMTKLREQVTLAFVARGCFLRSQEWYRSLGESYTLTKIKMENDLGMTMDDRSRVEGHEASIDQRVLVANPLGSTTCDKLRNSATMDRLDALQRQATGGYH